MTFRQASFLLLLLRRHVINRWFNILLTVIWLPSFQDSIIIIIIIFIIIVDKTHHRPLEGREKEVAVVIIIRFLTFVLKMMRLSLCCTHVTRQAASSKQCSFPHFIVHIPTITQRFDHYHQLQIKTSPFPLLFSPLSAATRPRSRSRRYCCCCSCGGKHASTHSYSSCASISDNDEDGWKEEEVAIKRTKNGSFLVVVSSSRKIRGPVIIMIIIIVIFEMTEKRAERERKYSFLPFSLCLLKFVDRMID